MYLIVVGHYENRYDSILNRGGGGGGGLGIPAKRMGEGNYFGNPREGGGGGDNTTSEI